jgi:tetratricopeptide (TPR) repeat protein
VASHKSRKKQKSRVFKGTITSTQSVPSAVQSDVALQNAAVREDAQATQQKSLWGELKSYLPDLLGVGIAVGGWLDLYNNANSIPSWLVIVITLVTITHCLWLYNKQLDKKKLFIAGVVLLAMWLPRGLDTLKVETQEITTLIIVAIAFVGWLFLFRVYNSNTTREFNESIGSPSKIEGLSRDPKWRKVALAGLVLLPLLTVSGFVITGYIKHRPSDKTIILLADFQGPDLKYSLTQTVINRMNRAVRDFPGVQIITLGRPISEGTNIDEIRKLGDEHNASIIIRGFYNEALSGTVHIDQLRQVSSFSLRQNEMDFDTTLAGGGITVQEVLSGDMSLLTLLLVGVARYDAGDFDGAIDRFNKALQQLHSLKSEDTATDVKFFLGKSLYEKRKYEESINKFQEVLSLRKDNAEVLLWLGVNFIEAGRNAEAELPLKRALEINEKSLSKEHLDIADTLNGLARFYYIQTRYNEAEPLLKRALEIREKTLGKEHTLTATSSNNLGLLYHAQGKYNEAEPLLKAALNIYKQAGDPETAISLCNLAEHYREQGKYNEAEPLYKRSLRISEKSFGPDHAFTAANLNGLAIIYKEKGRYSEAEPLYKRALEINKKALGPDHPIMARALNNLAEFYRAQEKYAEAEPLYKRAIEIIESSFGKGHVETFICLNNLALLYGAQGRYNEAEPLFKRALEIKEKTTGELPLDTALLLENYAALLGRMNRQAEAAKLKSRAEAIREKAKLR